ncbi:lipase family protein [Dyella mobilis]|uniref:Lipase family protein n=1 Tax=Dyella mobilis TaxID=1849582 RepID=A0ABS2KK72_9GAMM|nr:lipase family protein [Dyella mobilis]MBM7131567.1 lipase family protein [Dyella mobilis]GLQ96461.1 hypothetical protein GCM10007863_08790 [Dyella mobilis]
MTPRDYAILAQRSYQDAPTVGWPDSASRMHVYDGVHVFRGSDDVDSWLHDFDIDLIDVPGLGKLHAGFYTAWLAIRDQCLALAPPKATAGHSLGGALTLICCAEWALRDVIVPVYAFEAPRLCADGVMAALLKAKNVPVFATRNGNDIVTQVPPLLTRPGELTQIGHASAPFDNVTDHSIGRVIQALPA